MAIWAQYRRKYGVPPGEPDCTLEAATASPDAIDRRRGRSQGQHQPVDSTAAKTSRAAWPSMEDDAETGFGKGKTRYTGAAKMCTPTKEDRTQSTATSPAC